MTEIEDKFVNDFYETNAKSFSDTRRCGWDWIDDFVNKLNEQSTFYYDIGCGNGRNLTIGNSIGIDNCQAFIDEINQNGKKAIKSDMTEIKLPSESTDAIICIAAFHHLATIERRLKALTEMRRLIRLNVKMLLSVWSINQPENRKVQFDKYGDSYVSWTKNNQTYNRYYYIFQIDEIKQLFESTNWKIINHYWKEGNEVFELEAI